MKIEVLGPGCSKCKVLEEVVGIACKESGIKAEIVKVTDIDQIIARGVFTTPGLVIDGKVRSVGKVLTVAEMKKLLA